jgi:hypothetical protein
LISTPLSLSLRDPPDALPRMNARSFVSDPRSHALCGWKGSARPWEGLVRPSVDTAAPSLTPLRLVPPSVCQDPSIHERQYTRGLRVPGGCDTCRRELRTPRRSSNVAAARRIRSNGEETKRCRKRGLRTPGLPPGDDPAQAVHDEQLASLSDTQLVGLAQAIKDFMDRKQAEEAVGGTAEVIPFRPERRRRP